ncbi:MAG TPA: T9SS type A sorting domain-containing protein, partial [Ignavibacteriaceae bacterium]|nr:T9SS type A sorting domain-containing protein [Ignavibacteriaceae bacterium]
RFVNRFYPAIAGQAFNGFNRLDEVLGDWISNHLDLSGAATAWGLTISGATLGILGLFATFEFNVSCLSGLAYPDIRDGFTSELSRDSRSLVGLMLSDMSKADELAINYPDRINIESYNSLKNSILFTNPTGLLNSLWNEYKSLGTKIYNEVGPLTPDGLQPGKWYYEWSPWHKQSMAWGVLSSLNNSIPDIYTSNQNVAVYDAYFQVNDTRITGPQNSQVFQSNPVVKTKIELYNTSNVPSESITLKVKRDHNSTDYSLDPLKTSTTFSIDQDPLLYNTTDRKKIELTVPSVSLTELTNYRGYYMEAVKNSNNKAMFTSSFEQYQERLDLTPNYARLYGSYDQGKWPVSLGLIRSVATVNLNAAQFPEGGGSGGNYLINGIQSTTFSGYVDDYITIQSLPPQNHTFWKWSDENFDNPRTVRIANTNTNLFAIYKKIQTSNQIDAYSNNSQRKFVSNYYGVRFSVYTSLEKVWIEYSTNNGQSWHIGNKGRPLFNGSPAKNPTIEFYNISGTSSTIYVAAQINNNGESEIAVSVLPWSQGYPEYFWETALWILPSDIENCPYLTTNFQPVIGLLGAEWIMIAFQRDGTFIWVEVGQLLWNYSIDWNYQYYFIDSYPYTLSNLTICSTKPPLDGSQGEMYSCWLAYEERLNSDNCRIRVAKVDLSFSNPIAGDYQVQYSNQTTISDGSGSTLNTNPSISTANGHPIVSWTGAFLNVAEKRLAKETAASLWQKRVIVRRGDINSTNWGSFQKTGTDVYFTNNNSAVVPNNEYSVITWDEGSSHITKWFKRINSSYGSNHLLSHSGIQTQVSNGVSFQDMSAMVFNTGSVPFFFTKTSTDFSLLEIDKNPRLEKVAENDTIVTFGRSGTASINAIEFVFETGDILVGDSIIKFLEISDTLIYSSPSELNAHTRTENFVLTPETQFYFTNIYSAIQKSNPDTSLKSTDAVNFKVELVKANTNQVVGTFDNVTYSKNNLEKYASIDYEVDCFGITPGDYYLRLVTNVNGNANYTLANIISDNTTLAKKNFNKVNFTGSEIPTTYELTQNFPNPFNPSTKIRYQIAQDDIVTLKIYDILGAEVATLVNEEKLAGKYEVNFNASSLASGVYIYRIKSGDFVSSKKMILLK